jgi:hypothetical protein
VAYFFAVKIEKSFTNYLNVHHMGFRDRGFAAFPEIAGSHPKTFKDGKRLSKSPFAKERI